MVNRLVFALLFIFLEIMWSHGEITDPGQLAAIASMTDPNNGPMFTSIDPTDCSYSGPYGFGRITCDASKTNIVSVSYQNTNTSFTLPPEMGGLTAVTTLLLGNLALSGTLPSEWSTLTALQEL